MCLKIDRKHTKNGWFWGMTLTQFMHGLYSLGLILFCWALSYTVHYFTQVRDPKNKKQELFNTDFYHFDVANQFWICMPKYDVVHSFSHIITSAIVYSVSYSQNAQKKIYKYVGALPQKGCRVVDYPPFT